MNLFHARSLLKHNLGTACEAAGTGAAMLLLPTTAIDLVFGTHLLELLSVVALILAIAAIVMVAFQASMTGGRD